MAKHALTFENAGGDTRIVHISFETDLKAEKFKDTYNSFSVHSKIIRYYKLMYEMPSSERSSFKIQNFSASDLENFKVMYRKTNKDKHNLTIPYLDKVTTKRSDIENLMSFVNDFFEIRNVQYKEQV